MLYMNTCMARGQWHIDTWPIQNDSVLHFYLHILASENKPRLKDLTRELYHTVADRWKPLGILLEIPKGTLAAIATQHSDPHSRLLEMLEWWLKRVDPPATWSAIADAVEFLGEEQLARELRLKYCQ